MTSLLDRNLSAIGLAVRYGKVWTTDAPYRETREQLQDWAAVGVLAVEMQAAQAAVASVALVSNATITRVSNSMLGRTKTGYGFSNLSPVRLDLSSRDDISVRQLSRTAVWSHFENRSFTTWSEGDFTFRIGKATSPRSNFPLTALDGS